MQFFDRLKQETAGHVSRFQSTPLIRRAVTKGVDLPTYLDFLAQAYHHVRHTCPLLGLALSRLAPQDGTYREALLAYIDEEKGHEEWILDDIAALGGNANVVRRGAGRLPCRTMVSHAYALINWQSPYCLLGMVHVLEGMSVALANAAAETIGKGLPDAAKGGFSYLRSHGALDREHVQMFATLLNSMTDKSTQELIIAAAKDFYVLYGAIFEDIDAHGKFSHVA